MAHFNIVSNALVTDGVKQLTEIKKQMSRCRIMTYLLLKRSEYSSVVQLCVGSFAPHL